MLDLAVYDSFKLMHYVVASLHLKALDYFIFSGFSANVVYVENWFVCVLLSCCYTCFVYASILCYKNFSSTSAMMKNDQSDAYGSRACTPYSYP